MEKQNTYVEDIDDDRANGQLDGTDDSVSYIQRYSNLLHNAWNAPEEVKQAEFRRLDASIKLVCIQTCPDSSILNLMTKDKELSPKGAASRWSITIPITVDLKKKLQAKATEYNSSIEKAAQLILAQSEDESNNRGEKRKENPGMLKGFNL